MRDGTLTVEEGLELAREVLEAGLTSGAAPGRADAGRTGLGDLGSSGARDGGANTGACLRKAGVAPAFGGDS